MSLICKALGHAFRPRFSRDIQRAGAVEHIREEYAGEVCRRCGQHHLDQLSAPPILLSHPFATIEAEGHAPMLVAITSMEVDFSKEKNEIKMTARAL